MFDQREEWIFRVVIYLWPLKDIQLVDQTFALLEGGKKDLEGNLLRERLPAYIGGI